MNPAESTAREMAARGIRVFPCHWPRKDGTCSCEKKSCVKDHSKHPLYIKGTLEHGYLDATTDPEQLATWDEANPKANWAAVPGPEYFVIDRDLEKEGAPEASAELEKKYPGLRVRIRFHPPLRMVATIRGSRQAELMSSLVKTYSAQP